MTYASTEPGPQSVAAMRRANRPTRARAVIPMACTAADMHAAALTACRYATDPEDAAALLDALGLVDVMHRPTWRTP